MRFKSTLTILEYASFWETLTNKTVYPPKIFYLRKSRQRQTFRQLVNEKTTYRKEWSGIVRGH